MVEELHFKSAMHETIVFHLKQCKEYLDTESYKRRISQLKDWDNYLVEQNFQGNDPIDEFLVNTWINRHCDLAGRTIMTYVNSLRKLLMFYSQSENKKVYIPPSYKYDDDYIPYFFTDEDMDKLYALLDQFENGLHNTIPYIHIELPMIVRMLDANGFRLTELITTQMKDVNLDEGYLRMINTKNDRQRLVFLTSDMTDMLKKYCRVMGLSERTDMYLFPKRNPHECLTRHDVDSRFCRILILAGIRQPGSSNHKRGPCIHCLRHRFVYRSIKQLLSHGIFLEDAIPYLSIYLGHDSLSETEKYLKFAADFFPEELDKFEAASQSLFPDEKIWDDWM